LVTLILEGLTGNRATVGPESELQMRADGIYGPAGNRLASFEDGWWVHDGRQYSGGWADGPLRLIGCNDSAEPLDERVVKDLHLASSIIYADGKMVWEAGQRRSTRVATAPGNKWHFIKILSAAAE
jgi:hypothetical protein